MLLVFAIIVLVACDKNEHKEPQIEKSVEEKIEELLTELEPPIEYDYIKEEVEMPDCKLQEIKFSASYETPNTSTVFYYEDGLLSKVELYYDDELSNFRFYTHHEDNTVVKVFADDSIQLYEYIHENSLLVTYIDYDDDNTVLVGKIYYSNSLPNRLILINNNNEISVFNLISDQFGNILEVDLVWEWDKEPYTHYRYVHSFDNNFNPYYQLKYYDHELLQGQNNEIHYQQFVDGVLMNEGKQKTFQYNDVGFLSMTVDSSHTLEYIYECD